VITMSSAFLDVLQLVRRAPEGWTAWEYEHCG
jgi:hypothetical protein